ncbi:MAG: penicillin-binding transpeptidase domain-containing protein, partial [Candidatus Cloacimonadaceae bacterium]|nr:penicillin-binding transpeptidase domain-containing protein [Candidatus Cloacimonadaceae bacterium]
NRRWTPQNYSRVFYGFTRMRVALQHSYNLWAVKTLVDIGLPQFTDVVRRFGFNHNVTDYSAALGTYEVSPIDLISAYTTFPNDGYRVHPIYITKVEDDRGRVLERSVTNRQRVCESDVAYLMNSMLQTVAMQGTGGSSRANHPWISGGKTGTTDSFNDAWYIGYNKELTLGIWSGFDQSRTLGSGMSGGVVCAPIWGTIMRKAILLDNKNRLPKVDDSRFVFSAPGNIVRSNISPKTGFSVGSGGIEEIFIDGSVPPVVSDTLNFNFHPTRWGFNDAMEIN